MTWLEISIIAVTLIAASALQASIGFGMGMLAAPVIGLIDPTLLPGSIIMLAVVVTAMVAVRERAALDVRGAGWALVGRIPGSLAGAWLVAVLPAQGLAWLVALVVLGGVILAFAGWSGGALGSSQSPSWNVFDQRPSVLTRSTASTQERIDGYCSRRIPRSP